MVGVDISRGCCYATRLFRDALVAEEDVVGPGGALLFRDDHGAAVEVARGCPADGLLRASALRVHRIAGGSARRSHEVLGVEGEAGARAIRREVAGVVVREVGRGDAVARVVKAVRPAESRSGDERLGPAVAEAVVIIAVLALDVRVR